MALKYLQVNDATGKAKRLVALYVEDFFTTANGSTVDFILVNGTLAAANLVDVWLNGILLEETADYTRNTGSNKITMGTAPLTAARVRVRVWS